MSANFCRTILMLVLVSGVCSYIRAQEVAAVPVMTLEESINLALEKNHMLKQAREATYKAAGRIVEAKAAGYPQVGLSSGYIRRDAPYDSLPLAVGFNKSTQQLVFETAPMVLADSSTAGVTVSKVIDINGLLHAATKSANIGAQITDLDLARTRNALILQVKEAYYAALRARDLMAVADEAVKNAQTRLGIAQALVKSGVNPKLDVYRAETSVATSQQNQIAARNAYELAKASLNNVIGRGVDAPFEVQASDEPAMNEGPFPDLMREAIARRPEIIMAEKNIALSKQQATIARSGQLPSLVVSAGSTYDLLHQYDKYLVSYASVQVQMPLYDGGLTKGRVEQAKADIESAKINEDNVREMIALEVRQASLSLQNNREETTTSEKAQQQATESLRVSRARYQAGVGDQLELSDAELAYTQAQQNLVNARYDLLVSQSRLAKSLGWYAQ